MLCRSPIGGSAADAALDEARGVLYISNFTANRIEVMSLATGTIRSSINVFAQPGSMAMSPDGRWLLVAQYGNNAAPASTTNALTLIDLSANNAKQTFALGNAPLCVAFAIDGKALAVTTRDRNGALAQVATAVEQGAPDYVFASWGGVFAPARTPTAVVKILNQDIRKILSSPELKKRFEDMGLVAQGSTPEQVGDILQADIRRWSEVIQRAKIEVK